jgi:hypothetical protein
MTFAMSASALQRVATWGANTCGENPRDQIPNRMPTKPMFPALPSPFKLMQIPGDIATSADRPKLL